MTSVGPGAPGGAQVLAGRYRLDVEIIDDPRLHREDFEIRSIEGNRDLKRNFS